ncbi:MAG: NUDIX domain-containing protein [Candidatus Nanohaloarchaea archaeon]
MGDPRGGAVDVAVAVPYSEEKDRFLVLKRAESHDPFPERWEFSAGYMEEGEDAGKAALRELEEETGLKGEVVRTGEPHLVDTGDRMFRVHPFLVKVDGTEVEITEEHVDYRWEDVPEIRGLDTVDGLMADLRAVGVDVDG